MHAKSIKASPKSIPNIPYKSQFVLNLKRIQQPWRFQLLQRRMCIIGSLNRDLVYVLLGFTTTCSHSCIDNSKCGSLEKSVKYTCATM